MLQNEHSAKMVNKVSYYSIEKTERKILTEYDVVNWSAYGVLEVCRNTYGCWNKCVYIHILFILQDLTHLTHVLKEVFSQRGVHIRTFTSAPVDRVIDLISQNVKLFRDKHYTVTVISSVTHNIVYSR